jgi:serine/threonine-protein kinase
METLPIRIGDVVADKYRIESVLGRGGMGVVLAAHHVQLQKKVALKFLLPSYTKNPEAAERFLREAQNATAIQSEHVVRVMDVGASAEAPYMVMEYLDGKDLGALLAERGSLPMAESVDYVLQAMEALAEAHALGMVHRDLKPSNLFLTVRADGSPLVKVLDFGISRLGSSSDLTQANGIMGSPLYMAPEHLKSARHADARSDIWSLGVILYALIAGRAPFARTEITEIVTAVITEPPPPIRTLRPDVPAELERVILRCLAKEPDGRFPSLAPMARALRPFGSPRAEISLERIVGVALRSAAMKGDAAEARPLAEPGAGATWLLGEDPLAAKARWSTGAIVAAAVLSVIAAAWLVLRASEPAPTIVAIEPVREAPVAPPAPPVVEPPREAAPPPPVPVAPPLDRPRSIPRPPKKTSSIDELIEDRR